VGEVDGSGIAGVVVKFRSEIPSDFTGFFIHHHDGDIAGAHGPIDGHGATGDLKKSILECEIQTGAYGTGETRFGGFFQNLLQSQDDMIAVKGTVFLDRHGQVVQVMHTGMEGVVTELSLPVQQSKNDLRPVLGLTESLWSEEIHSSRRLGNSGQQRGFRPAQVL